MFHHAPFHGALLLIGLITLFPVAKILGRTGHSRWWCVLTLIPLVNWIALWVFAWAKWPVESRPPVVGGAGLPPAAGIP